MYRLRTVILVLILFVITVHMVGCGNNFFDPTQIGRFRPVPTVNVILDSLGVAEEAPTAWEGAEDPRPVDLIRYETDYTFSPGDTIRISIFELFQDGLMDIRDYVVTETGKISVPEVGDLKVAGLTESQLEDELKDILSPTILVEPSITVTLRDSQQRIFSIQGAGVPRPGRYGIPRYGIRLREALAMSGGIGQFNISNVFVSRPLTGKESLAEPVEPLPQLQHPISEPQPQIIPEKEMMEIIAPTAKKQTGLQLVITSSEMITEDELTKAALPEGFEIENSKLTQPADSTTDNLQNLREASNKPFEQKRSGRIEWIFQDGKWIPVQVDRPAPKEPFKAIKPKELKIPETLEQKPPQEFDWTQLETTGVQARVIKIPADKLRGGDPRYDVIIRPGDSIHVPVDIIGEFLITGNVNRAGFIDITGRPINLKQAIAAAGGLGPMAWPKRCEGDRRIGRDREQIVMVDLDKIAKGEQPDFFIKPNDLINVGTHPSSRWRAVLRNAFRATYGFGFIYDRNFGDRDFGTRRPIPSWLF